MNTEKLFNLLNNLEVECLRCGECCKAYDVTQVPGYGENGGPGHKPGGRLCKHCQPAHIDGKGNWQMAECAIHERADYPWECKSFKFFSGLGFCALGVQIWRILNERNPEARLPEPVRKAIEELKEIERGKR